MTAPVFFSSVLADPREVVHLDAPEAKHMRVMRIAVGEAVDLVDGRGTRMSGTYLGQGRVRVQTRVEEPVVSPRITLVQALAKGGRDEQAIEMATEVGVHRVVAWQSERAIVRWGKSASKETASSKVDRGLAKWRRTLEAATKQSRRSRIPDLDYAADLNELLATLKDHRIVVLHEAAELPIEQLDPALLRDPIAIVVGPEGGITDAELTGLTAAGGRACVVGDTVMRSSTAGTVGITLVRHLARA
ncbi:16S rRNA (uracil(1498)-N(3))-methyltransferase [Gleimia hominis]|uniref:16S rRNA (uracil(1498)-N(3))-methyltransferase n=1 Tax=Gleimia hominis TaxID=595468 RepID=UPI000C7F8C06|nr:16S rRNA (uracil(1498)-N(3))-methyltransferase [Gleimia hominis]WIK64899.1 16S rRNA (uracil(1498)-N(3))-methyltransferase [Gleimia hominis]